MKICFYNFIFDLNRIILTVKKSQSTKQSGVVLILVILIITVILGVAAVFSNLIVSDIQQSRLIDQSIQAYYLAESGAERSLYQVRRREAITDCSLLGLSSVCNQDGYCADNQTIPCINQRGGFDWDIRGGWQVAASNEEETSFVLKEGESFQIDLFNPYQSEDSNIRSVDVTADTDNLSLYAEFINLSNILKVDRLNCTNQPPVFKDYVQTPALVANLDGKDVLSECSYSFRLTYPLNSITQSSVVTLKVFDPTDLPLDIPSRLVIDSQATFGNSLQKIKVRTPMRPPLSGLYDFVLFSEQPII
ncbi:MAG: hypothetical protein WCW26_05185, partial [Candidatus Buchananbacteria bacterium]